ncbi:hypothetical protein ACTHGU_20525 [Chitinophagaceae bacterium MMS25-I14]
MKRKVIGLMALAAILTTTIFIACKKETQSTTKRHLTGRARLSGFSDWPTIENGMLSFRDPAHFSEYCDFLDSVIITGPGDPDTTGNDPNEILEGVESGLGGFISLRHITEANFQALNEVGWDNMESIPEKHFINDISIKSILNADADVKVGDKITHFINKDFAVTMSADDPTSLTNVHGLTEAATIDDISHLDPDATKYDIQLLSAVNLLPGNVARTTGYPFHTNCRMAWTPDPCNNPKKVQLDGIQLSVLGQAGITICDAYFNINWGDGTSTNGSTSNQVLSGVTHVYPSIGSYTITINGRATSPITTGNQWDDQLIIHVTVPNGCNYKLQRSWIGTQYTNNGMNRSFKCKAWIEQWTSPFGVDKHKVGAYTESYLYTSNKWKTSRIDHVSVSYLTTEFASDCTNNWGDGGGSYPGNTTYAEASHTNPDYVGWFSIHSSHQIIVGSSTFTFDHDMKPCN